MGLKYPNTKQFKQELDGDRLENRYLFLGEEEGEKDKYIKRIIGMAVAEEGERQNATGRFHIENDEFLSGSDFALSPTMFSSRRMCVMYNINTLQFNKNSAVFHDLVFNLPDSTILIMTSLENKPPIFMSADVLALTKTVQFWRYFDTDIYKYVSMSFRRLGLAIDDRAVELLIERTGNDIKKIDDAIDMLRFSGRSGAIGTETIRDCVDDLKDASIFEFIDSLFKLEKKSLALFKKIFENGTPDLKIIYMILRQAEMIEEYYTLIEGGMSAEEAARQAGVYSKNRENFRRYTEKLPPDKLKRVFPLISSADYQLKSGGRTGELIANPVFNLVTSMVLNI